MPAQATLELPVAGASSQSAEISGWDVQGQFFVEIADLDLGDPKGATTRLCHRVADGSLVFVRLRPQPGEAHSHPTASEAYAAAEPDFAGRSLIRLSPCQPRLGRSR